MNEITIEDRGIKTDIDIPENFSELTKEQLIAASRYIIANAGKLPIPDTLFTVIGGIHPGILKCFSPVQKYHIKELFNFILEDKRPSFKEQKIDQFTLNGSVYYGYQGNFGNLTWEEFIFADQFLINKMYKQLIAVLYRPERSEWDEEVDRRIPFSSYGITRRVKAFEDIDEALLFAIILNYRAIRSFSLEEKYTAIFPYKLEIDEEQGDTEASSFDEVEESSNFSWVSVHRNLLGDQFYQEEMFLKSNVHTVLNRLNKVIIENRKRKK